MRNIIVIISFIFSLYSSLSLRRKRSFSERMVGEAYFGAHLSHVKLCVRLATDMEGQHFCSWTIFSLLGRGQKRYDVSNVELVMCA